MSKFVTTEKGTKLPLLALKGKDYLMVAYRLQWLSEKEPFYTIDTEFLKVTDDEAICRTTIKIFDQQGRLVRSATATKKETKKDFPDFVEKSESSSAGRALSMLGFGTQHALADLDEGLRLADSPLEQVVPQKEPATTPPAPQEPPKKLASFRKPSKPVEASATPPQTASSEDDWS